MEQTEIPERFKNMSIEEITEKIVKEINEINGSLEKKESLEIETRKMAIEALRMKRELNIRLTQELRAANERYHKLLDEKTEEFRRLVKIIERTNDKVYDIGMEIAKRIQALEDLKSKISEGDDREKEVIDSMIELLLDLMRFIEYRLVPIPLLRK